jgi:CBS domain-containing protein
MKAADVMVTDVITVQPHDTVRDVAAVLLGREISAAPVVDDEGRLVGIVSEGDLMRRAEIDTERRRSWWLEFLATPQTRARDFVKAHAVKVADVMTRNVVTATEDMPLADLITLLEKRGIKRVPVVRGGAVVGIVSRRNILQAFAQSVATAREATASDAAIREAIIAELKAQPWGKPWLLTVTVTDGIVELWGLVDSEEERQAVRVAAEAAAGVKGVKDNLFRAPRSAAA